MIRFSAFLVVVAVGLLVAGVVTSKLLFVYIAIGVSAVALLALGLGAAVNWRELTSKSGKAQPETPAPGTAQPGTAQPGTAQPGTAQPGTAQPGTAQPGTGAAAEPVTAAPSVQRPAPVLPEPVPAFPAPAPAAASAPASARAPASAPARAPASASAAAPAPASAPASARAPAPAEAPATQAQPGLQGHPRSVPSPAPAGAAVAGAGAGAAAAGAAPAGPGRSVTATSIPSGPSRAGYLPAAEPPPRARPPAATAPAAFTPRRETPAPGVWEWRDDSIPASAPPRPAPAPPRPAPADARDRAKPAAASDPEADSGAGLAADSELTLVTTATSGPATFESKQAKPDQPAGEAGSAGPDPGMEVTVVPGVPRYHNARCILIRFMGDSDLDKTTLAAARDAGCTPCRACLPDEPERSPELQVAARLALPDKAWMSHSCRSMCMNGTFTSNGVLRAVPELRECAPASVPPLTRTVSQATLRSNSTHKASTPYALVWAVPE